MPTNGAEGYPMMRGDGLLVHQYGHYGPYNNLNNNNNNVNNNYVRSEGFGSRPCLRCGARENVVCEVCFAPYCNAECQKLDWSYGHVIHCKPIPGSVPCSTLLNALATSMPSRVPVVVDSPLYGAGNVTVHRQQQQVFSRSSSRSDSGERSWVGGGGGAKTPYRTTGEKSHSQWATNAGLEIKKVYTKGDSEIQPATTTTSTLNGAAPAWKPRGKLLQGNFMGIPDDIWNNIIRSFWPATESTMKINVLAMGNQCGGFYDFAGVIDGSPETFLGLQQLEVEAAAYCEKVKEAYVPSPGDMVLAKYDGMFYRAVALNHKRVWFMDYGNFGEASPMDMRKMPPELLENMPVINLFKFHGIKPAAGEAFDEQSRHQLMSSWEMMTQIDAVCKGLDENGRVIRVEVPALYKQLSDAGVIRVC